MLVMNFIRGNALTGMKQRTLTLILSGLALPQAFSVSVQIDYTYDTANFFGTGNPSGAAAGLQAKNALEAAAGFFQRYTHR